MAIIHALLTGATTGAAWSITGYLKGLTEKKPFDAERFLETIFIGVGLGTVIAVLPININDYQPFIVDAALTGSLTPYAQKLYSAFKPRILKLINSFKK